MDCIGGLVDVHRRDLHAGRRDEALQRRLRAADAREQFQHPQLRQGVWAALLRLRPGGGCWAAWPAPGGRSRWPAMAAAQLPGLVSEPPACRAGRGGGCAHWLTMAGPRRLRRFSPQIWAAAAAQLASAGSVWSGALPPSPRV
jgi:hypothetical protein